MQPAERCNKLKAAGEQAHLLPSGCNLSTCMLGCKQAKVIGYVSCNQAKASGCEKLIWCAKLTETAHSMSCHRCPKTCRARYAGEGDRVRTMQVGEEDRVLVEVDRVSEVDRERLWMLVRLASLISSPCSHNLSISCSKVVAWSFFICSARARS